jgi:hypothetical protein
LDTTCTLLKKGYDEGQNGEAAMQLNVPPDLETLLAGLARREIRRRRLLAIFEQEEPIWKDEDHPELAAGADEWVGQLRRGR